MKTLRIWVPGYNPWGMGGHVHYTLAADIECEGPFELGKGLVAYTAKAPNGTEFVVDSVSLGIVGASLESAREDVETGELEVMHKQQRDAKAGYKKDLERNAVQVREPGYFWAKLNAI
jgi:hypothetical protein